MFVLMPETEMARDLFMDGGIDEAFIAALL